ncbi:hypothetical protein [Planomonospora algeriensis]
MTTVTAREMARTYAAEALRSRVIADFHTPGRDAGDAVSRRWSLMDATARAEYGVATLLAVIAEHLPEQADEIACNFQQALEDGTREPLIRWLGWEPDVDAGEIIEDAENIAETITEEDRAARAALR